MNIEEILDNSITKIEIMKRNLKRDSKRIDLLRNDLIKIKKASEEGKNENG